MSAIPNSEENYIPTAPEVRRPPSQETGVIGWLRHNLFSSTWDTVLTVVLLGVMSILGYMLLDWALTQAQWEIAISNVKVINTGYQFPVNEVWRAEVAGVILIALLMFSVGVWGSVTRAIVVILAVIALAMVTIPILTKPVKEPTMHMYLDATYLLRQVSFVAEEGQEIQFRIEPLTDPSAFDVPTLEGYIENDNQLFNTSWDMFNTTAAAVIGGQVDPATFDLNMAVQVWNRDGEVIAESDYTQGQPVELDWTAPAEGWYTFTVVRNEEAPGESGYAWLLVDNVETMPSTSGMVRAREEKYGPPPALDCEGCATQMYRTDVRFQGERSVAQWFSLQLAPFLLVTRQFFFMALVAGVLAYGAAKGSINLRGNSVANGLISLERGLLLLGGAGVIAYLVVNLARVVTGDEGFSTISFGVMIALSVVALLYTMLQLMKEESTQLTRGIVLLWVFGSAVILAILAGVGGIDDLPAISSSVYGGLLLTILLSAVAILCSIPIGIVLALGRQSSLPVIRILCTIIIEVIRGVPLVTLIFMGRYVVPYFAAALRDSDLLLRMCVVLTAFSAAYMAEIIRGGLQIVPKGHVEAARALGLSELWITNLIVLPQAIRAVIPAIMGQAVSLFKDTSLVVIIGLYELLGTMTQVLGDSQTGYLAFPREGYLYIGIIYFVISYMMAEVSRRLERTGSGSVRRDRI